MKKTIIGSTFTILLFSRNAFAGGQLIDCESEFTNIRVRASFFSEQGIAHLRDSSLKFGNYEDSLKGELKTVYSSDGAVKYYKARTSSKSLLVKIYPNKTFDLLLGGREYFLDSGKCHHS